MITDKKEIHGYKAFASDGTNIALETMPLGDYHYDGEVKYGKSGYHFATRLEDTIRYSGTDNPIIAEVIGYGTIDEGEDDYYGYYDVYSASNIKIVRYLSREEIIEYALQLNNHRLKRFIVNFELTGKELDAFINKSSSVKTIVKEYEMKPKKKVKRKNKNQTE